MRSLRTPDNHEIVLMIFPPELMIIMRSYKPFIYAGSYDLMIFIKCSGILLFFDDPLACHSLLGIDDFFIFLQF